MLDRILDLPAQARIALFAVIVVAVLGLGYLTLSTIEEPSETENAAEPNEPGVIVDPALNGAAEEDETVGDATEDVELELVMPIGEEDLKIAAARSVEFAELFLSYRYDLDAEKKANQLNRLLATDNTVDLGKVFPTGRTLARNRATERVVGVKVTHAEVVLISPSILSLELVALTSTTLKDAEPVEATAQYAVTLTYDIDQVGWYVTGFTTSGASDFQDEG